MRKVSLTMLTPDMKLGKAVCYGSSILIREGTNNLDRYMKNLEKLGIHNLYIEDDACEGIEIEDIVSDMTRLQCKASLRETMSKIEKGFAFDQKLITHMVEGLLEEIIAHPNTLVSLSEIGSTDESTLDHSINTTIYSICLGLELKFGKRKMMDLAEGTLLHDFGKTGLEKRILFKSTKLTAQEFEHIKTHTILGYEMLRKIPSLSESSRQIALCHHERMDGSGYPGGLTGNMIPQFAKIAAIVDVYEALISDRCYRKAVSPYRALEILTQDADTKLDLALTAKFMQNVAAYPNGTTVYLSDGNRGIISRQNHFMPLRPVVRVVYIENGKDVPKYEVDLMKSLNLTIIEPECAFWAREMHSQGGR